MGNYGLCGLFGKLVIGGVVLGFFLVLLECYVLLLFTVWWKLVVFLLFLVSGGFLSVSSALTVGLITGGGCRPTYGTKHEWDDTNFSSWSMRSVVN